MNFNKKNKIEQRLSMLFTNLEAWVNNYHNLYQLDYDDTLKVRQSDNSSCIKKHDIPNLTGYLNASVKHGRENPQFSVNGDLSELYINQSDNSLWACTKAGFENWEMIFTGESMTLHNTDPLAHSDFIARITGNPEIPFNVKNAKELGEFYDEITAYLYTAVNKEYTGDTDLAEVFGLGIGDKINRNYTIVGNPTIYNEGRFLVGGIDGNNYVYGESSTVVPKESVNFRCRGIVSLTPNAGNEYYQMLGGYRQDRSRGIYVKIGDSTSAVNFDHFLAEGNTNLTIDIPTLVEGDIVEVEVEINSIGLNGNVWVNGEKYSGNVVGSFLYSTTGINRIYMGSLPENNYYWTGTIDLEGFELTVDSQRIYKAIAYKNTKANTGSQTLVGLVNGLKEKLTHIDNSLGLGNDYSIISGNIEQGNLSIIDTSISEVQQNVSVGTYYTPISSGDIVEIELVGAGGGLANRNGGIDEYNDTQAGWQYYHSGGGGAYFKGTFTAWTNGTLRLITPENGGDKNTKGGDAVATFIDSTGAEIELARAGGGSYAAPAVSAGFLSNVAGGAVTYNSMYITATTVVQGSVGSIYSSFQI